VTAARGSQWRLVADTHTRTRAQTGTTETRTTTTTMTTAAVTSCGPCGEQRDDTMRRRRPVCQCGRCVASAAAAAVSPHSGRTAPYDRCHLSLDAGWAGRRVSPPPSHRSRRRPEIIIIIILSSLVKL